MKKLLLTMLAFTLCLGMVSCKKESNNSKDEDKQEVANDGQTVDIKALAEKAEKEGANWTVEEWKKQFKNMMVAMSPVFKDNEAFTKRWAKANDEEKKKIADEWDKLIETKYKGLLENADRFEKIAKECENAQKNR